MSTAFKSMYKIITISLKDLKMSHGRKHFPRKSTICAYIKKRKKPSKEKLPLLYTKSVVLRVYPLLRGGRSKEC